MFFNTEKCRKFVIPVFFVLFRAVCLMAPLWIMDLCIRKKGDMEFYSENGITPILFTIVWSILFVAVILVLDGKVQKILYWIINLTWLLAFVVQSVYYSLTSIFFGFSLLQMADEGGEYIVDAVKGAPVYIWGLVLLLLLIMSLNYIFVVRRFGKKRKRKLTEQIIVIAVFIGLLTGARIFIPNTLGRINDELQWNNFSKPRNVYESFSDSNKSMRIAGLYEYMFRNFYLTYLRPSDKMSEDDREFLKEVYGDSGEHEENEYTGIFKDKNVIFLQLEGIDNWLLDEETMPNLYSLCKESLSFENHFSLYTGGGSTFNSEFSVNTGFMTPVSYNTNVYTLSDNSFPYTMARMFKNEGYTVNCFHMNSKEFYSRGVNYRSWGYDNYWGLSDLGEYDTSGYEYQMDSQLILNQTFYDKMFRESDRFVDYIITYTPHTPFTAQKGVGKYVAQQYYGEGRVPDNLTEEDVVRLEAGETDKMIGLLIQALKDEGLYRDTVIVAYADHYLYTINDKTILDRNKDTYMNLINRTPFFIWSADNVDNANRIERVTMQLDVLPTVLNLMGIDYRDSYYVGSDALAGLSSGEKSDAIAFFPDFSWYDGNVYYSDGVKKYTYEVDDDYIRDKTELAQRMIRKNDLTLKYNYFK